MYIECKYRNRLKGNSLLYFPEDYIVLDLETTGLNPQIDEVIEIGALKVVNNEVIDTFHSLVRPNCQIDDFITNLTGISYDDVKDAPNIISLLPFLKRFFGDFIIAGHNVHFDINFLYDLFESHISHVFNNDIFDLLRISRVVFPDFKNHRLVTIAKHFDIAVEGHHRALKDCYITKDCISSTALFAKENNINMNNCSYYQNAFTKSKKLSELTPESDSIDPSNYFFDKTVVFTGELEYYPRKEAAQMVINLGAIVRSSLVKSTDILVVGDYSKVRCLNGKKSSKHKKAEDLVLQGKCIEIMDEQFFYELIEDQLKE